MSTTIKTTTASGDKIVIEIHNDGDVIVMGAKRVDARYYFKVIEEGSRFKTRQLKHPDEFKDQCIVFRTDLTQQFGRLATEVCVPYAPWSMSQRPEIIIWPPSKEDKFTIAAIEGGHGKRYTLGEVTLKQDKEKRNKEFEICGKCSSWFYFGGDGNTYCGLCR